MKFAWIPSILVVVGLWALVLPAEASSGGSCGCTTTGLAPPSPAYRSHSYPPAEAGRTPVRRGVWSSGFGEAGRKVRGQY
jgi:hypothetical protein